MNELYIDIHSFFCHIDHYRVLSRVPCAVQFFSYMLSCFSCVQLSANPLTVARQSPLSMGFSRQEYWSGLPFPTLICFMYSSVYMPVSISQCILLPVSSGNHKFAASDFHFVNKPLSTSLPPQILCISNI